MAEQKKRITWIDMAKGYGMILVIVAHCDVGNLGTWINSFHMPLFFILSGYVFSAKADFSTFIKKKCKSMLVPYFCLGIPMLLFDDIIHYLSGTYTIKKCLYSIPKFLLQQRMYTLWFLACLFVLNIIFYFAVKVLKTNKKLAVSAVLSAVIGLVYCKYVGVRLPWDIDVSFMAYPFFFAGYYYKQKHEIIDKYLDNKKYSVVLFLLSGAVNIAAGYFTVKISGEGLNMFHSSYGFAPLTFLAAFAGSVCVIILAKWFTVRPVRYIGENSLLYFAWHQTIMIPVSAEILSLVHMTLDEVSSAGYVAAYKTAQILLIIGMLTVCNLIISKTKLKFMLGK